MTNRRFAVLKRLACALTLAVGSLSGVASAGTIYGIDDQNNLFSFDSNQPSNVLAASFVSNLQNNEHLVAIDVRPSNGALYGLGSTGRLYTLNPSTGATTAVGTGAGALSGTAFGMDFDPVTDRIRLVSDTDINRQINPDTGALISSDATLHYSSASNPSVVGAAYTTNDPGASQTTLYGIDSVAGTLVRIGSVGGSPNSADGGLLTTVGLLHDPSLPGSLGISNSVGFDIASSNLAFVALQAISAGDVPRPFVSRLYAINLTDGALTNEGTILGGLRVVDIAVDPAGFNPPVPEPGSMMALGGLAMFFARRRR
jgi:hypothetical protein